MEFGHDFMVLVLLYKFTENLRSLSDCGREGSEPGVWMVFKRKKMCVVGM